MPQALKLRNGVWEWDASLGEQCAAEYDRIVWHAPRPAYEQWTVEGDTIVEVTTPIPDFRAAATERVRIATQAHIEAVFPDWYQRNCALAVYPEASCEVCAAGIAACVEACNRVEDLIAVAADAGEIAAAESVLALPTITRSEA